nr:hypothetical protein [Sorangium cellulosum]
MCDVDSTCWPNCTSDAQCPEVGTCDTESGGCYPPIETSPDGSACALDSECTGDFCITEALNGWPGGACSGGCNTDSDCNGGACLENASGFRFCIAECATSGDCRSSYSCRNGLCLPECTSDAECTEPGFTCRMEVGTCAPPPGEGADGAPCTTDGDCAGGYCSPDESGWPGGYCWGVCDDTTPCAGGGICTVDGYCNSDCATSADCRDGYECTAEGCYPAE